MNVAVLIFLIINLLFIAVFVIFAIGAFCDSRSQAWKRCHKAEDELSRTRDELNRTSQSLKEYAKRFPVKSKYKLNDKVFCKKEDGFTYYGTIIQIRVNNDNLTEYVINYKNMEVVFKETDVYLEKK